MGRDLDRRVDLGGGCPADQQGNLKTLPPHFFRDVRHLLQRRSDQPGEPDQVDLFAPGGLQNPGARHHDTEVEHLVVVTLENHADDVLADVVHIALDRGEQHPAFGLRRGTRLFRFEKGHQVGDCFFHDPGALDHLRQKHLAAAEEIAHHIHPVHEGAFDHRDRPAQL